MFNKIAWVTLLLACGLHNASAKVDLLDRPAQPSVHATRSLLLDVQRVGSQLFAVGEFGQVLKSTDEGRNWVAGKVPTSITLTALAFADAREGYAVGHDGVVLHTTDAGSIWHKVLDGRAINQFVAQAAKTRANTLQAQVDALPAGVTPAREALEQALDDALFAVDTAERDVKVGPSKPLLDVRVLPGGVVLVAGAYGQLLKSQDHGKTWTYLDTHALNPDNFHLNSMLVTEQGEVYVAGEQGTVLVSGDQGNSWRAQKIDYQGSVFSLVQSPRSKAIVAVGLRGHAFKLSPGAQVWERLQTGLQETFSAATVLKDGSLVAVGARGIVVRSTDDFNTLQVLRRTDKQHSSGVVQIQDELLITGVGGFKTMPVSVFK